MSFPLAYGDDTARAGLTASLFLELLDVFLELDQVLNSVVGYADTADFAFVYGFDEGLPGTLALLGAAVGAVQEDKVDVVEAELIQGSIDRFLGCIVPFEWC
jgi:hypothetical protein